MRFTPSTAIPKRYSRIYYIGVHYTTVSRTIKKIEREDVKSDIARPLNTYYEGLIIKFPRYR